MCPPAHCLYGGLCNIDANDQPLCSCPEGYIGDRCEIAQCPNDYCGVNSIQCFVVDTGEYSCQCMEGYTGSQCETNIDECGSEPCQNGGVCLDGVSGYECQCNDMFRGTNCESLSNACIGSQPCDNGAACMADANGLNMCVCQPGFEGDLCEVAINECVSNPCANNGVCIDSLNRYVCVCKTGYTGDDCSEISDGSNNNLPQAATNNLLIEPWWIALICLIGLLFVIFVAVCLCTMKRQDDLDKKKLMALGV
eukprot:XP_787484.3 PREDICTED: fibropellin-3 [Strongylocentrotus purpuratus]